MVLRTLIVTMAMGGALIGGLTPSGGGVSLLRRVFGAPWAPAPPSAEIDIYNSGYPIERSACLSISLGQSAGSECGNLRVVHALPSTRVFNTDVTPTLIYNSEFAHPYITIPVNIKQLSSTTQPDSVELELWWGAYGATKTRRARAAWRGTEWPAGVTTTRRVSIRLDSTLSTDTTGVYAYSIVAANWYNGTRQQQAYQPSGGYHLVNRSDSPYGAGWWLAGHEQVKKYYQSGGTTALLWIGGDGSTRTFTIGQTMYYDRLDSITYDAAQQRYIRRLPEGRRVEFDATTGRHVRTVNRFGRATQFVYAGTSLTLDSLKLPTPAPRAYAFAYSSNRLMSVTAPRADYNVSRVTLITNSGGNITQIRNAGDSVVGFAYYGSSQHQYVMNQRTARTGTPTNFTYDSALKVRTSSVSPGFGGAMITQTLVAGESRGLPRTGTPSSVDTSMVYTWLDGPRAGGDSTVFRQGRFGTVRRLVDATGATTHIQPQVSFDGFEMAWLTTRVKLPLGRVLKYEWDDRANLLREIDSTGTTPGVRDTTAYTYDATYDQLTSITRPEHDGLTFGVNASNGRRDWQQDNRGVSSRISYGYDPTYAEQVTSIQLPVVGGASATYSYTYFSGSRNSKTETSPLGYTTSWAEDSIGRVGRSEQPIDSSVAATKREVRLLTYTLRGDLWFDQRFVTGGSAESIVARSYHDADGLVVKVERNTTPDPATIGVMTTQWRRDNIGRPYAVQAADGRVDSTVFDEAGNATSVITRRYGAGNPNTMQPIISTYDVLNRLSTRTIPAYSYPGVKRGIANLPSASTFKLDSTYGPYAIPAVVDTFTYTLEGQLRTANNRWARIARGYSVRGDLTHDTLDIARQDGTFGSPITHRYVNRYVNDRNARRSRMFVPAQFGAVGQDSIAYTYSAWGALEHVRDPLGTDFLYTYDARSRLMRTTFGAAGVDQTLTYDHDGRIRRDSVSNNNNAWPRWQNLSLRRSFFSLDAQGRQLTQRDSAWYSEQARTTYTDLGYLTTSYHAENAKTVGLPGFLGTYYHIDRDTVTLDGLGNRRRAKNMWETGMNGPGTPVVSDYTYAYRAGVGRVDSMTAAALGTRTFAYDSAGNEVFSSLNGLATCQSSEDRASFYDGLNRVVAEQRRWVAAACNLSNAYERSFEEYRYDALGRRVWSHSKRECDLVPAGYPEPVGDLALQCRLSHMRRTVWDGMQELVEVQAPGAPADAALWEQDVGYYPALPLDARSSPPKDPNRYYGQVVYTTGLVVDQPLSVRRLSYADRPTTSSYTQWPGFTVIPIWDRQGTAKLGVFSDGAWAKQLVPTVPPTPCQSGASAQRCVQLVWAEASSAYDLMRGWAPQSYMGALLEQKRNASGTYDRRARVYDPATGRFTQEDPIGLAGGLNLYGYANGDPVNFSDPFGLCTIGKDCWKAYLAWRQANIDRCLGDVAGCLASGFGTGSLKIVGVGSAATGARFLAGAKATSFGRVVGEGTVDLAPTRARIAAGEIGEIFQNREGLLPKQSEGYYTKHVVPTPGVKGAGPQRLIVGKGGEEYYTPDHYKTFTRVNP